MMDCQTFANQSSQTFNQNVAIGGYPPGYPPMMPQYGVYGMQQPYQSQYSPFISPFPQPMPFVPNAPIECCDKDGNVVNTIQQQPSIGFNQGGSTVSQGGFNPVTGTITPPVAQQGFASNPYTKFIGNSVYGQNQGYSPYSPLAPNPNFANSMYGYGVNGITAPFMRPYGYGYNYGYGQNQFDTQLQEILYNQQPSVMDAQAMLAQVVLSDEEREKIDHHQNYMCGVDYYGRPIYFMDAYRTSQQRQNQFEEARQNYQKHFTMLSRIAHAYSKETIDEEKMMKRFDPVPPQKDQPKLFNYYTATDAEKKEYERNARVEMVSQLTQRLNYFEYYNQQLQAQRNEAYARIKASHDELIGVKPGEHYDLKTYMDNGYKIGVNIAMQKAKSANRNGTNKYSRNDFRGSISQVTNTAVPITSKDDEYVSIEQMLKGVYDRNRMTDSILRQANGQTTYTSGPTNTIEEKAHIDFLEAMQAKKNKDDLRRAGGI